ncbi:MAG: NAD(P)/FAD-dependent oxidoreductase [Rhabdochlamydiaceae bacterium]
MKFCRLLLLILLMFQTLEAGYGALPIKTAEPQENKIYPIAIIGAGAAGTMAVKRAILDNHEVLLFTGDKLDRKRSCGNWVKKVDNVPGLGKYTRTVLELRNEVLEEIAQTVFSNNLFVIEDSIASIEKQDEIFKLVDNTGRSYDVKFVVLATGIMKEQPQIQQSIRPILKYANAQTIGYCCLCDGHRCYGKKTVVIGHTNFAAATALDLKQKYQLNTITLLTNGQPHEFAPEQLHELEEKRILICDAPIHEIIGNEQQKELHGFKLATGDVIEAEIGFVSLGIRANNKLAVQLGAQLNDYGLVITSEECESSVPNLFVIGDLRANSLKQIYTAWQHAVDALQEIDCRIER